MIIKKIAVIGAGTMGNGIAQLSATSGYQVMMIDVLPEALERGQATISRSIAKLHGKGRIGDEQMAAAEAIETSTELAAAADADIVIEAILEKLAVKRDVFAELDRITRPDVILATNTSSISITEIAACTSRPDKVVGMHFMNPVPLMKLIEVIRGLVTSDETMATVVGLSEALGKTPVEAKD